MNKRLPKRESSHQKIEHRSYKSRKIDKNIKKKKGEGKKNIYAPRKGSPIVYQDEKNLSFQEKGFDLKKSMKAIQHITSLFEQIKSFAKFPDSKCGGFSWGNLCREISKYSEDQIFLIEKYGQYYLVSQTFQIIEITKQDAIIWETIQNILQKMKQGPSSPGLQGLIKEELAESDHILRKVNEQIIQKAQYNAHSQIKKLIEQYNGILALKTFKQCFQMGPIDELNYYRYKQYEERHSLTYKPIENEQQWKTFIAKRRNKLRKCESHILHTACQGCLSPYYQQANSFVVCTECHCRYHRLCVDLQPIKRCGRCIYSRLSNELKQKNPQCILCGVTGLSPLKIGVNKFCHIFCLMSHKLWSITKNSIEVIKRPILTEPIKQCKICHKGTGFSIKCSDCDTDMHPLCAFLKGYNMILEENQDIKINCCSTNQQEKLRLEQQRKFLLNYEKYVFSKLDALKKGKKLKIQKKPIENQNKIMKDQQYQDNQRSNNQVYESDS